MKKIKFIKLIPLTAALLLSGLFSDAQTPEDCTQLAEPINQLANPQITTANPDRNMVLGVPTKVSFRFANAGSQQIPANTLRILISLPVGSPDFEFVGPYITIGNGIWTVVPGETGKDAITLINSGGITPPAPSPTSGNPDLSYADIEFWVKAKRANVTNFYSVNVNRYNVSTRCVGDADASPDNNTKDADLKAFFGPAPDINATYVNVTVKGDVSTNDKKPSGTTYGAPVLTPGSPAGSTPVITLNTDGTYTFTADKPGVYTYNVPVCVPGVLAPVCTNSTLTITVTGPVPISLTPAAHTDIASTIETNPVVLKSLVNDNSMDPLHPLQPSTVSVVTGPKNGTATVDPTTGDITYTANAEFYGKDTLFYQVCDNNGPAKCAIAMQIITVLPTPTPIDPDDPDAGTTNTILAADDYSKTTRDVTVSGNAKTNDTNPESGQTFSVTPIASTVVPSVGKYSIDAAGIYTFDPLPDFVGSFNFPYQVCDNGTPIACAKATVYITVNNPASNVTTPIGVVNFQAAWSGAWGKLTWKGAGIETAGAYYGIERSLDGANFQSIGRMNVVPNIAANYSTLDKEIASSLYDNKKIYYRLKLVDTDGTFKYSTVKFITKSAKNVIQLYPNPSKADIHFTNLNAVAALEVRSAGGQLLLSIAKINPTKLDYDFGQLPNGFYIVTLKMETGEIQNIKLAIRR